MNVFSPELLSHWVTRQTDCAEESFVRRDEDALSPSQQEALQMLADRVTAARSTV
jgi:hypothetical protein